jgi:hypothetical protein
MKKDSKMINEGVHRTLILAFAIIVILMLLAKTFFF